MATTIAMIDSAQMLEHASFGKREQEMDAVFSRHWPSFYRTALRRLGNAADAEDAVQDALLSAYKHLDQFRGQAQMSTWLTAIVLNSARIQLRKRPRQTHVSLDERPDQEGLALSELLQDHNPSPEERCRRSDLAENIVRLGRRLSPTLRTAFLLHHLDGLTVREITQVVGVPEGTVKARISRARAKLRSLLRRKLGAQRQRGPNRASAEVLAKNAGKNLNTSSWAKMRRA